MELPQPVLQPSYRHFVQWQDCSRQNRGLGALLRALVSHSTSLTHSMSPEPRMRFTFIRQCVACAKYDPHALDLTEGLFNYFSDEGAGVINVDWSFTDVAGGGGHNQHTTTSRRPHTTTRQSSSTHTTKTSYASSSHNTKTMTSTRTTSTTTYTSPTPTGTPAPADNDNFYNLNEFVLDLQNLLLAATA